MRFVGLAVLAVACGGAGSMPPAPSTGTPRLTLEPDSHDFGAVAPTTSSAPFTFTVRNTGDATADGSSVSLDTATFSAQSSCGSLEPGASCTVDVQFTPTAVGPTTAMLSVGDTHATVRGLGANAVVVTSTGGGSITSDPAGIACGAFCTASFAGPLTLTATPDPVHEFVGWGGACSGTAPCALAADTPVTSVTATFALKPVRLDVALDGAATGTVVSSPAGIDCGTTCTATFTAGQQVTLTATPTTGIFGGWSGACVGMNATCTIPLVFASSVRARFVQPCSVAFTEQPPVSTGNEPHGIVAADLDSDGRLDLVTPDHDDLTVSVMRGNGDGTFQPRTTLDVGVPPEQLALGDLDGDGKLDLVVASYQGLAIALGNGDGTFQPTSAITTVFGSAVALGDFDADGHTDLAVVLLNSGVYILHGHGDATFDAPVTYLQGTTTVDLAVADLDHDGVQDIVVARQQSVAILRGNGDGTFTPYGSYPAGALGGPWSAAVADLDGDGDLDVAAPEVGFVSILVGHGDATFDAPAQAPEASGAFRAGIADFTGDGVPDLAVANYDSVGVAVGNGNATFQPATLFPSATSAMGVAIGDYDGDGRPDIAAVNHASADVTVLLDRTVCN